MSTQTAEITPDTLAPVTDDQGTETTGARVKRLREDLGWTQKYLCERVAAAGGEVSVATVGLIERDVPAKRDRGKVAVVLSVLEREYERRGADAPPGRTDDDTAELMAFLARRSVEEVRIRRVGPHGKVRWLSVAIPDDDATREQIAEDLEDYHRQQRGLPPNG